MHSKPLPSDGFPLRQHYHVAVPLFEDRVAAGFPSPAEEYLDKGIDLNEHLIQHPAATYFVRASGDSLVELGIFDGDLLIVDRALTPRHGDIVVAALEGQLACKVLDLHKRQLRSANAKYPPIALPEDPDLVIEGVVSAHVGYHRGLT